MTEYQKPHRKTEGGIDPNCPSPVERLVSLMSVSHRSRPKAFPQDPQEAARFWMANQEPYDRFSEAPEKVTTTKSIYWRTPYHDRVCHNLGLFLALSELHQAFVLEHCKTIPWRGDVIAFYIDAVNENARMVANPQKYINAGFGKLAAAAKGMRMPAAPASDDEQAKRPL